MDQVLRIKSGQNLQNLALLTFKRTSGKLVLALHQRRGVISLEDIPVTDSAFGKQVVILMPEALQISDETAKESLARHLSANALQALQVSALQCLRPLYKICVSTVAVAAHHSAGNSAAIAQMQMLLLLSSRTKDG